MSEEVWIGLSRWIKVCAGRYRLFGSRPRVEIELSAGRWFAFRVRPDGSELLLRGRAYASMTSCAKEVLREARKRRK